MSVKRIAVLDRTKEPARWAQSAVRGRHHGAQGSRTDKEVYGGRYGLGSKEFTPSMVNAVFNNLEAAEPRNHFTIGIDDDVTHTSLPVTEKIDASPPGTHRCKFYGLAPTGPSGRTRTRSRSSATTPTCMPRAISCTTPKSRAAWTISHPSLRQGPHTVAVHAGHADFVARHNPSYVTRYDMLDGLREGGSFLLNSAWMPRTWKTNSPPR